MLLPGRDWDARFDPTTRMPRAVAVLAETFAEMHGDCLNQCHTEYLCIGKDLAVEKLLAVTFRGKEKCRLRRALFGESNKPYTQKHPSQPKKKYQHEHPNVHLSNNMSICDVFTCRACTASAMHLVPREPTVLPVITTGTLGV